MNLNSACTLQQLVSLPNGGTLIILSNQPHIPGKLSCFARDERPQRNLSRHRGEFRDIVSRFTPRRERDDERSLERNRCSSTQMDLDSTHRQSSVWFLYANNTFLRIDWIFPTFIVFLWLLRYNFLAERECILEFENRNASLESAM